MCRWRSSSPPVGLSRRTQTWWSSRHCSSPTSPPARSASEEVAGAYKEGGDAGEAVFGKTGDEEDIDESAPRHDDHEANTSAGVAGSKEE